MLAESGVCLYCNHETNSKIMATKAERQESIDTLETLLKPGTIVYTSLRHVSASGMTRWIDVFVSDVLHAAPFAQNRWLWHGHGFSGGLPAWAQSLAVRHCRSSLRSERRAGQQWWLRVEALLALTSQEHFNSGAG